MSDKNVFSGATMPVAAVSVIAIVAAIGVGLWVAAPDKSAPVGAVATEAAEPLAATGTTEQSAVTDEPTTPASPSTPVAQPQRDAAAQEVAPAQAAPSDAVTDDPAPVQATTDVADGVASDDAAAPSTSTSATATDDTDEARAAAPATATPTTTTPAPSGVALDGAPVTLDIVRIPPDGITTVAGHAPANTDVVIYVDGTEVSRATTNARGEFVALFDLMAADKVREMTVGVVEGGKTTFAAASIVVAPAVAAVKAADVDTSDTQIAATAEASTQDADPIAANDTSTKTDEAKTDEALAAPAPDVAPAAMDQTPTVLKADNEGVKVIQQAGTDATTVRIDALTYDPDGRVFASGRAPNGASIRLYLDTVLAAETQTGADGQWRVELKDVAAGVYALRADQIGPDGKVVSRAETPFKREDIAILAQIAGQAAQEGDARTATADTANVDTAMADTESAQTVDAADAQDAVAQATGTQEADAQEANTQMAQPASDPVQTDPTPPSRIASITVQPGNTLWGIASDSYGDGFLFARVFDANKTQIRDPDLIYPGQVFVLPQ